MAFDQAPEGGSTVAADQLASYVNRIERLEEEVAEMNGDKSEIYKEAKACGFDVKTLRALIKRRRMDRADRQEADALLELYEAALEGRTTKANGSEDDDSFLD